MNRNLKAIIVGQILFAVIVAAGAVFFGFRLSGTASQAEVEALRTELADTRERLVAAESDRDRLQTRVDALEQALLMAGIDPDSIPVEPSTFTSPSSTSAAPAPRSPAGRPADPVRPAEQDPPGRQPTPEPQPSPSPEDPDDEPPLILPPETCDAPVLGPQVCT